MTPEHARKLLDAATPGPWLIFPGANSHCFDARIGPSEEADCVAFAEGDIVEDEDGFPVGIDPSPDAALIAAAPDLARAYIETDTQLEKAKRFITELINQIHNADFLRGAAIVKAALDAAEVDQ